MRSVATWMMTTALVAMASSMSPALAETPKDTVVMARQIDDIITLDPAEAFELSAGEMIRNTYDKLLSFDLKDPSKLNGEIAESWTVSPDAKTYTFKLKPGLKFHSGNAVTAADVAYSFERAVALNKTPAFILTQFGFKKDNIAETVKAVDEHTLVITVDKPYAPTFFLNCLSANVASVVDSKLVKQNEKSGDYGYEWMKQNSAGSGAYKLRSWRTSEQYTLEANPDWYKGAPKMKRIVVRHVAEPASQRLLLEKGDIDYAMNLSKDQLAAVKDNKDLVQQAGDKGYIMYLALNQKDPTLKKPEVQEALKYLVDYDSIERNILSGTYKPHQTFLPNGFLGAIDDRPYKYDLEKAKALLGKAGVGEGFNLTMDARSVSPYNDVAQAVQASWAKAGIKLEIIPGDGKQVLTKYRARTHQAIIGEWGPDYQDPHTNAETFAINENNADDARSKTLAWRNSWDIPAMTKKTQALVFETDAAKRKVGYEEIEREHQKASPFVIMFQKIEVATHRKTVDGLIISPGASSNIFSQIVKN